MGLGVVDLLVTALDLPLPPGGDDGHLRGKALDGQLEADLIVALAGTAVGDGVGVLFEGDLHQALADDGPGEGGAQQVVLILGTHHHGGDDHIVHHLVHQVLDVQLGRAGLDGLLVEALQLVALPHVGGYGDDLGVVVVLLQPGDDDGCVQPAGVGEDDLLDVFFVFHNGDLPVKFDVIPELYRIVDIYAIGRLHNLLPSAGDFLQFWRKKGGRTVFLFRYCLWGGTNAVLPAENCVPWKIHGCISHVPMLYYTLYV